MIFIEQVMFGWVTVLFIELGMFGWGIGGVRFVRVAFALLVLLEKPFPTVYFR